MGDRLDEVLQTVENFELTKTWRLTIANTSPKRRSSVAQPAVMITGIIRELSPEQPVEQAATLDDVRAEVLAPDRLNALAFVRGRGVNPPG